MTPIGWAGRTAVLVFAPTVLSGCVAVAAIPAVAGGIAAKKAGDYAATTRAKRRGRAEAQAAALPAPVAPAQAPVAQAPAAAPLPGDLSAMRPGIAYAGSLPSPYATPEAAATPAIQQRSSWTDVGRYVAGRPATQADSALLVRGSGSEAPAWVPCAGNPRAVLVRLESAMTNTGDRWRFVREAAQWLDAFQTLEIPVIFTSPAPSFARAAIEAAFRDAGLARLLDLGELRLGLTPGAMPAERASIAGQRCVVALAGRDASDFPNALLPETTPLALRSQWGAGWFRVGTD